MSETRAKAKAAEDRSHTMTTTSTLAPFQRARGGKMRWRVERAGAPRGLGYGLGWLATCPTTGVGGYFTTWAAALAFAIEQTTPATEPTC